MGLFGAVAIGAFFAAGSVTMLLLTGVSETEAGLCCPPHGWGVWHPSPKSGRTGQHPWGKLCKPA